MSLLPTEFLSRAPSKLLIGAVGGRTDNTEFGPLGLPVRMPGSLPNSPAVCSGERPRTWNLRDWTSPPVSAAIAADRGRRLARANTRRGLACGPELLTVR